jgi:hypothetical protein
MLRGDLINSVALKTGLDTTSGSEEELLMEAWASDGVVEVLLKTHCFVRPANVTLQSGVWMYDMDTSILAITDLQLASSGSGDYERLSMDELRDLNRAGSTYKAFANHFGFFLINPVPTSSDTMSVLYVPKPSRMTSNSNDPSDPQYGAIPTQYHRAIEYYMLWQASEYDEKRLPEIPKDYRQQFEDECALVRKRGTNMGTRVLRRPRIGYPETPMVGSSPNDVYPER